jgi:hypothetical protein
MSGKKPCCGATTKTPWLTFKKIKGITPPVLLIYQQSFLEN